MRYLQTYEAECTIIKEETYNYLTYSCEIPAAVDNIKSVKLLKEFKFSELPPNITIISPLIETFMDNIEEVGEEIDDLLITNLSFYVLDHSKIVESKKHTFKVSGIITDPKPHFQKVNFTLKSKAEINKKTSNEELNCTIIDIIGNNYTLNCQGDNNVNYYLQNSMTAIDDEILILNFDENTTISFNDKSSNLYFRKRKTQKIALIVIIIVIAIICALAVIFAATIYLRKQKKKIIIEKDSTIEKL